MANFAGLSDRKFLKPRLRAQRTIYLCSTSHKVSEYVLKS